MSFSAISDVHIEKLGDEPSSLMQEFFSSPEVINSHHIFLLGDIFDLMIGGHREYFKKYSFLFTLLAEAVQRGQNVYYFEGNHDFHLTKLFESFREEYALTRNNFYLVKDHHLHRENDHSFYFSHGDDIERENGSHQIYRKIIRGNFFQYIAEELLTLPQLNFVGGVLSRYSKKKNTINYSQKRTEDHFRRSARMIHKKFKVDHIICGHSHVQDLYSEETFIYGNCGHLPTSKKFLYYDTELRLIDL